MLNKKVLFFVGRSYLVESAAYLSFELMKDGYITAIFCPFLKENYKKSFNNVFYYFGLDSILISIIGIPFFFFYLAFLVLSYDVVIIYQVKLSFLIKFWCILFKKEFYIIHSNSEFKYLDSLFSEYADKFFYLFPNSEIYLKNAIISGLPLSSRYRFSYIKAPKEKIIITFFIDNLEINSILQKLFSKIDFQLNKKIICNIVKNRGVEFFHEFKINVVDDRSDHDLIKNSHLIVCYANSLILSKVSSIGRPVFLVRNKKMDSNFEHFISLNNSLEIDKLASKIIEYMSNENVFYDDCSLSSNTFCESFVKDYI